jgi:hypothetical protein
MNLPKKILTLTLGLANNEISLAQNEIVMILHQARNEIVMKLHQARNEIVMKNPWQRIK